MASGKAGSKSGNEIMVKTGRGGGADKARGKAQESQKSAESAKTSIRGGGEDKARVGNTTTKTGKSQKTLR